MSISKAVKCISSMYRVFHNGLSEIKLKYCQQGLLFGLKMGHVHVPQVGRFVFLRLEWRLNLEDSLHSLQRVKTEVKNCAFFVDLSTITTNFFLVFSRKN